MANELEIVMRMRDDMTRRMNSIESRFSSFARSVTASIAGMVSAYKALRKNLQFAQFSVREYLKQEDAEKRLAAAMRERGVFTEEAFENYKKMASQIQSMTAVADDEVLVVQRLLTQYGLYGNVLERATIGTIDFARAKDMDLSSAADLVGKSLASSTNALTRYGVATEGAVGSTERFETLMTNLNKMFGGYAQAELESYGGKIKNLENSFGDLAEEVGKRLVKVLDKAASGFMDLFNIGTKQKLKNFDDQIAHAQKQLAALRDPSKRGLIDRLFYGLNTPEQTEAQIKSFEAAIERMKKEREDLVRSTMPAQVSETGGILTAPVRGKPGVAKDNGAKDKAAAEALILQTQTEMRKRLNDEIERTQEEISKLESELASLEEAEARHAQSLAQLTVDISYAMTSGIGKGADGLKESLRNTLSVLLSYVEKEFLVAKVSAAAKALLGGNPLPLAQLVPIALAMGTARAAISSFQTAPGQFKVVPGMANQAFPAMVHGGEMIGRPSTTNNMGGNTININVPANSSIDATGARAISGSIEGLVNQLMMANRTGRLREFKAVMAA